MIWKDIVDEANEWCGLRVEVAGNSSPKLLLESGSNCRFKLYNGALPVLWGTFGAEYWGAWALKSYKTWEVEDMPVAPINAQLVEISKNANFHAFWSRFFMKQLWHEKACLSAGIWKITVGYTSQNWVKGKEIVHDLDQAFAKENPRWIAWDIGKCGSLIALKEAPVQESGRVKWYRKLVKAGECPPVLIWYLACLDSYVILDGHARLKAFQLESTVPSMLILNAIKEEKVVRDPTVQQHILAGIEKRQNHQVKRPMNVEEVNRLLISAFDTRPYSRPITHAKARSHYEAKWIDEVRTFGQRMNLDREEIEAMIARVEY